MADMAPNYVFIVGRDKPVTTSQLAEETGIDRDVISKRAARAPTQRKYKGKMCGVLDEKDLVPPVPRKSEGRVYGLKLSNEDRAVLLEKLDALEVDTECAATLNKVKKSLRLDDTIRRVTAAWDKRVRGKQQ